MKADVGMSGPSEPLYLEPLLILHISLLLLPSSDLEFILGLVERPSTGPSVVGLSVGSLFMLMLPPSSWTEPDFTMVMCGIPPV